MSEEPTPDPSPFDLPGEGAAVLCLHGLTGTPYEVRPIGEACAAAGMRAVGPALPGHNESPEALARVRHTDWLEAARVELSALRASHERVCVAGVSMGGLVTLALAAEGELAAIAVVGTPLRLRRLVTRLVPLLKYLVDFSPKRGGSDIRDPTARQRHPTYPVMPLASVHELQRLQRRVRALLPRVQAPILVAHGEHDVTAHPDDAREIHRSVASVDRELLLLESSAHIVSVDHDGPRLAGGVAAFFQRHA